MANWWEFIRRVKHSKNDRRFYSSRDMAEAKRLEAVSNSQAKRGERKKHVHMFECGCGAEGCFILR